MKKLIFFAIASAILLFSLIVVNIAPAINGLVKGNDWFMRSCSYISDEYDDIKKRDITRFINQEDKDKQLERKKKELNRCNNKKAMVGLEYVTSNFNIIFGFICALLGFLLFMNLINIGKYIGLIGLGVGAVGFVLTFVYVIESGLVFDDIDGSSNIRTESDGAVLEWKGNKYVCIFYDKDDEDSIYLRYSDYGKKYLNYHKDLKYPEGDEKYIYDSSHGCLTGSISISWTDCKNYDEGRSTIATKQKYRDGSGDLKDCGDKLYYINKDSGGNPPLDNKRKIIYDRWLTTIIFSCFIFLLDIGLAIFGFLLFRESGGSSGQVAIK